MNENGYGGALLVVQVAADAAQKVIRDLVRVEDGLHVVNAQGQLAVEDAQLANDLHIPVVPIVNCHTWAYNASVLPFE